MRSDRRSFTNQAAAVSPRPAARRPPPWSDATPLAHALIRANVTACLWGSDWPHTDTRSQPTAAALERTIEEWCRSEQDRRTLLAENPARLFTR
ncbi:MAG TPA: amidohydrolase family protein [Longimicrobiales bacterium]|nr:amidohydrolase family protein [Longimicrobiales bacterium]